MIAVIPRRYGFDELALEQNGGFRPHPTENANRTICGHFIVSHGEFHADHYKFLLATIRGFQATVRISSIGFFILAAAGTLASFAA